MLIVVQVSYSIVDLQSEIVYDFNIVLPDISSSVEYTWTNLIRRRYQFSVIAFTSKGPGEAASFMLSTLPDQDTGMLVLS